MSLAARLGRLTPALTGKERALLALRARNAGQTPDPELRPGMTPEASREYNRYAALIHVANAELGMLCTVLAYQVECLEAQAERVLLLEEAAALLVKDLGETLEESRVRNWRSRKQVTVPVFLRGLAAELREGPR
jgi:hypothetical protein